MKDLGKALGMYVIVVNCSEGLDYKSMGRMYSGLAQVSSLCLETQASQLCPHPHAGERTPASGFLTSPSLTHFNPVPSPALGPVSLPFSAGSWA